MGSQVCNGVPRGDPLPLTEINNNNKQYILQTRQQMKQLPVVPTFVRDRIVSLLSLTSIDQLHLKSKIWKVKGPTKFYYINQPSQSQAAPIGRCSIYVYQQDKKQFMGYFHGMVTPQGTLQTRASVYVYGNGDYFVGDKDKDNHGTYVDYTNQYKYEGDWMQGRPHGIGKQITKKGVYEGYFLNGKKEGKGKYVFVDGTAYEGEFSRGEICGEGRLYNQRTGYEFVGGFVGGVKEGAGVEKTSEFVYEGQFVNNRKQGQGKLKYLNTGLQYLGQFLSNMPNGKGTLKTNTAHCDGIFRDGQLIAISKHHQK